MGRRLAVTSELLDAQGPGEAALERAVRSVVLRGHHGADHDPDQAADEVPVARAAGHDPDVVADDQEQPDYEQRQ